MTGCDIGVCVSVCVTGVFTKPQQFLLALYGVFMVYVRAASTEKGDSANKPVKPLLSEVVAVPNLQTKPYFHLNVRALSLHILKNFQIFMHQAPGKVETMFRKQLNFKVLSLKMS